MAAFVVAFLILTTPSCMKKEQKKRVTSKNELIPFLDTLERRYEAACKTTGEANWHSYAGDSAYDLDAAKAKFAEIFLDTSLRNIISEWHGISGSLADPLLTRRLELWKKCFIGGAIYADPEIARLENGLQKTITEFKLTHKGKPTTRANVSNALRQERRQKRRHELWSVAGQISNAAVEDLLALVRLRNKKAVAEGFPNYYSLSLYLHSIDEAWLLKTLHDLEKKTRPMFEEFIASSAKKIRAKEFGPWDFDYALHEAASLPDKYFPADSVFSVIHNFESGIGFRVSQLPIQEVVNDIPYGGLSLAIKIPHDSRFLVNPTKGKGFYAVAFHEYGHSLKAVHTTVRYPILKGYEWIPGAQCAAYEEGVAEMHGEFTEDTTWITTYTKVKEKELTRYLESRNLPALYRLRRLLKDFFIEHEMYKNPDQDMAALEREMYKKYLLVQLDSTEQHQFASSIWYTSYPCYYQNYILAAMIATQLQEAMSNKFEETKLSNPKVAAWMKQHLYATGEETDWMERIRDASGKGLETGAYLRKLGIHISAPIHKD